MLRLTEPRSNRNAVTAFSPALARSGYAGGLLMNLLERFPGVGRLAPLKRSEAGCANLGLIDLNLVWGSRTERDLQAASPDE